MRSAGNRRGPVHLGHWLASDEVIPVESPEWFCRHARIETAHENFEGACSYYRRAFDLINAARLRIDEGKSRHGDIRSWGWWSSNSLDVARSLLGLICHVIQHYMGDKAEHLRMIADDYNVPVDVAKGAMERAAADYARAMTARAQPAPRPKWPHDAKPDKTPAHFASRAGYVHRGEISSEDRALHKKLFNWLRTHDWPGDVPYIPTLPEWNERQAVKLPELRAKIGDEVRQVKRLEAVARRVAHTAPRIPAM